MLDHANSQDYKIPASSKKYFRDVHTMLLVSFFSHSGSSLLGYLLTAHPNMIVADQPEVMLKKGEVLYEKIPFMALLNYILYIDKMRFRASEKIQLKEQSEKSSLSGSSVRDTTGSERYISIPNQWQGHCKSLRVVGIKNTIPLAKTLVTEGVLEKLRKNLKRAEIYFLKFIFTTRNPYDMISTAVAYRVRKKQHKKHVKVTEDDIYKMLDYEVRVSFPNKCKAGAKIFELMDSKDIFLNRHEDLVHSPVKQLNKICDFLKVPALPDYLDDCASVVSKKPNKSRHELEWPDEAKEIVEDLIVKHHFFSGYSWDS